MRKRSKNIGPYKKRNRCTHDFTDPKKTGFARYECRACGQEITLMLSVFDSEVREECKRVYG